jgi:hypothetical protein
MPAREKLRKGRRKEAGRPLLGWAPVQVKIGMKMERKRTELTGAIFVFIFLCGNINEYRNA